MSKPQHQIILNSDEVYEKWEKRNYQDLCLRSKNVQDVIVSGDGFRYLSVNLLLF